MKNFKFFLVKFILHVYTRYIVDEDLNMLNMLGKIAIYPAWFVRSIIIWLVSPIFIPEYFYMQSYIYKEMQKVKTSPEYEAQMMKMFNMFNF